jgi:hypothetical protein
MTAQSDLLLTSDVLGGSGPPPAYLVGRMVSLRFVVAFLRRRRRFWLTLGALGLVLGAGYHVVVPRQYQASSTLYLAHTPGTDDSVDMT